MNSIRPTASRRQVLTFGAASLAAITTLGIGCKSANKQKEKTVTPSARNSDPYGGFMMGIQTYTLRSMSLDNCLAAVKSELKLGNVELYSGHIKGMSPKQVVEALEKHGLKCPSFGVVPFDKDHDANRKHFELGQALGSSNLSCDPENDPKCWDSVGKLCDEYKMTVAIHPHGPGANHKWIKIDQMWEAIKDVNPKIGVNDETGWLIAADEDPVRCLDVFKERTYAMHLKDFKKLPDGKLEDVPAGQGQLDVDALVKKMLEMKFKGIVAVEYEAGEPVIAVQQSLERIKEAVKKARAT